jgi:hypothetical protein
MNEEHEMKRQFFYRPILVAAITLTFCLLVAILLMSTRSVGATMGVASIASRDAPPAKSPQSPSSVAEDLPPQSTAAYNGVITPDTTLYAPWLLGGTSVLRVYNAGESAATVWITFTYDSIRTSTTASLAAGAVGEIKPPGGVLTGTKVSAILKGDQPLVAIVNDFGLEGKQATSYAAMPASLGQTYLALPDIYYRTGDGWESKPVVQNVGVATTSVTMVYTRTTVPPTTTNWMDVQELAPDEVYAFDPSRAGLPENFVGIATIEARQEQPLIAIVHNAATEIGELYPRKAYIYRVPLPATGGGGSRPLYFPLLVNAFEDWTSSRIQFMNAKPTTTTFDLEIGGKSSSKSIDPWWADSFGQDDGSQAQGWVGAGRVEDAQSLHSLVWLRGNFDGDLLAAYSSPSVGAKTGYLPYADQGDDFAAYVAIQNLADSSTHITLTYHSLTGTLPSVTRETIAPFDMRRYAASSGFVGGVVVQADQPVAAVAVIAGRLVIDETVYLPVVMRNK